MEGDYQKLKPVMPTEIQKIFNNARKTNNLYISVIKKDKIKVLASHKSKFSNFSDFNNSYMSRE